MAPASCLTKARTGMRACKHHRHAPDVHPGACPTLLRAEDIIVKARAAERDRAGIRTKIRLSARLSARARECAKDVDMLLGDWVNCACRKYLAGRRVDVAESDKTELATRKGSECFTVRAPAGMKAAEIRLAVLMACAYCEDRKISFNPQPPSRYFLETGEN